MICKIQRRIFFKQTKQNKLYLLIQQIQLYIFCQYRYLSQNQKYKMYQLKHDNLIPIYLLEDNLKQNFKRIQQFINTQNSTNDNLSKQIKQINGSLIDTDLKYTKKFPEMEKVVFNSIKQQIQGTVTAILNNKLATILQKISQSQDKQLQKQQQTKQQLQTLQKKLSYQISQQNQKYFAKQITRIQKQLDKKVQTLQKNVKFNKSSSSNKKLTPNNGNNKQDNGLKNSQSQKLIPFSQNSKVQQHSFLSDQTRQTLEQLKKKVQKIQQFTTNVDKRIVDNYISMKENWKELGNQLLDNKKVLNKKVDELNVEFIKIKNTMEFANMPETMESSFKTRITQKFTEIYKVMSSLMNKSQFQMVNQRNKKILNRHTDELVDIREQLAKNNEYFTFYMNNSKTDDLNQHILKLKAQIIDDRKYFDSMFQDIIKNNEKHKIQIQSLAKSIGSIEVVNQTTEQKIQRINQQIKIIDQKIQHLQDLNDIGPSKMKKIHDTLDLNYAQSQTMNNETQKNAFTNQMNKQLRNQVQKLKDQIFLLISQRNIKGINQQDQINNLKEQIKKINKKMQKTKYQNQQAMISRKPWICLSCDKEKLKEKVREPLIVQRDSSRKKVSIDIGKAGGYLSNRNSQKSIKYNLNTPPPEQKFQMYQKYRQKYLSDTLKLPQIYRQKFGDLEDLLM